MRTYLRTLARRARLKVEVLHSRVLGVTLDPLKEQWDRWQEMKHLTARQKALSDRILGLERCLKILDGDGLPDPLSSATIEDLSRFLWDDFRNGVSGQPWLPDPIFTESSDKVFTLDGEPISVNDTGLFRAYVPRTPVFPVRTPRSGADDPLGFKGGDA